MKEINIGGKAIPLPEGNAQATTLISHLQDLNETGQLSGMFVVYSSPDAVWATVLGALQDKVLCSVVATALSEQFMDQFVDRVFGRKDSDDEDD